MRLKLLLLVFTALLSLNVQAQESSVEEVDSTSFELVRLRAREKVQMFMDYYQFITDKKQNMVTKAHYIQRATELFLPGQGMVISSVISPNSPNKKERRQTVKSFLEGAARGLYRTNFVVESYEFCHNCRQIRLSGDEVEITFCKHSESLRDIAKTCMKPNGYVTCTMPLLCDNKHHIVYLSTLYCYMK